MSKATSPDTSEMSCVDDLSSDVSVKMVREVHCFRWYAETRWLARHGDCGVLLDALLEPTDDMKNV